MTSDEAMKEAWEENRMWLGQDDALFKSGWNAALEWAKSGQEPVAWQFPMRYGYGLKFERPEDSFDEDGNVSTPIPLYRHSAPAQPVRLSDSELRKIELDVRNRNVVTWTVFAHAIQDAMIKKAGEK